VLGVERRTFTLVGTKDGLKIEGQRGRPQRVVGRKCGNVRDSVV
jgi:hypothetical protein